MLRLSSFARLFLIAAGASLAACSSPAQAPLGGSEAVDSTSEADSTTSATFHIDDAMFQSAILGRAHPEQSSVVFANGNLTVTPSQGLSILLFKDAHPEDHAISTPVGTQVLNVPGATPQYFVDLVSLSWDSASFQAHLSNSTLTLDFAMSAHFFIHNNYIFSPDVDLYIDRAAIHIPFFITGSKVTLYGDEVHVDLHDHINGCIWGQLCNRAIQDSVPSLEPKFEGMIRSTLTNALNKEAATISSGLPDLVALVASTSSFPPPAPANESTSPYEIDRSSLRVIGNELQSTWSRTVAPACKAGETGIGFEIDCTTSSGDVTLWRQQGSNWVQVTERLFGGLSWRDSPPNGTAIYDACVADLQGRAVCSTFSGVVLGVANTNNNSGGSSGSKGGGAGGSNTNCGAAGKSVCQSADPG